MKTRWKLLSTGTIKKPIAVITVIVMLFSLASIGAMYLEYDSYELSDEYIPYGYDPYVNVIATPDDEIESWHTEQTYEEPQTEDAPENIETSEDAEVLQNEGSYDSYEPLDYDETEELYQPCTEAPQQNTNYPLLTDTPITYSITFLFPEDTQTEYGEQPILFIEAGSDYDLLYGVVVSLPPKIVPLFKLV